MSATPLVAPKPPRGRVRRLLSALGGLFEFGTEERLLKLGGEIVASGREPATEEERRAVALFESWEIR